MSLVNGGFADWKKNNFETESTNDYPSIERGNFKAKNELDKNIIKFEEFNKKGGILDDTSLSNVFDTRIRPQFEGTQETGLNPQCKNYKLIKIMILFRRYWNTNPPYNQRSSH
jgi:3-mercaptopyruvate sulfurtransferase SseA